MTDIALQPAHALAEAIRRRDVSSRELLDHYLARVERLNPPLNAVVTLDPDAARRAADAADAALARGEALGPLHGVPMTVKDTYETAGIRTTCGVEAWDHVSERDADAVQRLRDAGAVIFGKTNAPNTPRTGRPSTRSSAPPTTPGTPRAPPVGHRVGRPPRLPPA